MAGALDLENLAPGTVLVDKYRVVRNLGVGGMGVVIAAEHLALGTTVAIKFLLPQLVHNELVVKRFLLEAQAATRIDSEHVARVMDVGTLHGDGLPMNGVPFMVMDHLDGHDLSHWIRAGRRFPVQEAINLTVQAAEALAQAHKVGIIHRDIKPANLFLQERDGRMSVKVLDFGISKILSEGPQDLHLTKTTAVLGSGLYMSPEQMRSAKGVDFRSDIYSLGVCIYELLTGTHPYTAESFSDLCIKVATEEPTPLRTLRPDVSEELAAVIGRAYARDPKERYQTVQQFASALSPFAEGSVVVAISEIQGITHHESVTPPPPLAPLARTNSATTLATLRGSKSGGSLGLLLGIGAATALLAAGAAVLVIRSGWLEAPSADPTPPALASERPASPPPSAIPSMPTATASPLPSAAPSAAAGGAGSQGGGGTSEAPPVASVKATPQPRPRPRPRPRPDPNCGKINEHGLLIPCD